jgi:hypothetical protein
MYRGQGIVAPPEVYITPFSRSAQAAALAAYAATAPASATVAADRAHYYPVYLLSTAIAYRLFVLNGATVGTDKWDVAIYASDANHLPSTKTVGSGATTSAGANVCQYFNITDTTLMGPRLYYIGFVGDIGTDTTFRTATPTHPLETSLYFQETVTNTLPATATPVAIAAAVTHVVGLALRASP